MKWATAATMTAAMRDYYANVPVSDIFAKYEINPSSLYHKIRRDKILLRRNGPTPRIGKPRKIKERPPKEPRVRKERSPRTPRAVYPEWQVEYLKRQVLAVRSFVIVARDEKMTRNALIGLLYKHGFTIKTAKREPYNPAAKKDNVTHYDRRSQVHEEEGRSARKRNQARLVRKAAS